MHEKINTKAQPYSDAAKIRGGYNALAHAGIAGIVPSPAVSKPIDRQAPQTALQAYHHRHRDAEIFEEL
jgi:hypothetical protein